MKNKEVEKVRKETAADILSMLKEYLEYSWTKSGECLYNDVAEKYGLRMEE